MRNGVSLPRSLARANWERRRLWDDAYHLAYEESSSTRPPASRSDPEEGRGRRSAGMISSGVESPDEEAAFPVNRSTGTSRSPSGRSSHSGFLSRCSRIIVRLKMGPAPATPDRAFIGELSKFPAQTPTVNSLV